MLRHRLQSSVDEGRRPAIGLGLKAAAAAYLARLQVHSSRCLWAVHKEVAVIKDLRSHTTLPAADLGRAKKFYAEKLGLSPSTE